jgi:hypothetical protein
MLIICTHAIADMITDTFQIYRIEELKKKRIPFSKRKKISIVNMSEIEYIYISSLIWIVSYKKSTNITDQFLDGGSPKDILYYLETKRIPVLGEECYPFEETLYKLLSSVNKEDNKNVDGTDYKEMAINNLKSPLFGPMNELKDGDIFYRNRCKEKIYNNELVIPINNDNRYFITITKRIYLSNTKYIIYKIIGLTNTYKLNSIHSGDEILQRQQFIKKAISCDKQIIISYIYLFKPIQEFIYKKLGKGIKFMRFDKINFTKIIKDYKEKYGIDIDIPFDKNNIEHKKLVAPHALLIYGWLKNKDDNREYWIIRDSNYPDGEYYLPLANIADNYFIGLEITDINMIGVRPSDELQNRMDRESGIYDDRETFYEL